MQEEIERMIASLSEAAPENTAHKQASDTVQTKIKEHFFENSFTPFLYHTKSNCTLSKGNAKVKQKSPHTYLGYRGAPKRYELFFTLSISPLSLSRETRYL